MRTSRSYRVAAAALCAGLSVALVFASGAGAKGTPSNVTVTCGADVQKATVTVQLLSDTINPTPASNRIVLACSSASPTSTAKISPLTQPAAAYAWSAFVTATGSTFGCGGFANRGTQAVCTNAAGGSGQVTILAS